MGSDDILNLDEIEMSAYQTGLQAEASNVPTLISLEPNNAKSPRRKNCIVLIEKGVIKELSRRGITLIQAALLLLVTRSTLKRRCKDRGITWRPDRKKNGGTANKEIQLEYTIRVKGGESKVMFPVNSNTPLETLRKDLKNRLDELHPREEGKRIMVLRVHMELGNGNGKDHKVATAQGDTVQHYQIKNEQLGEASKAAKRPRGDQVQSHDLGCQKEDHEVATVLKDNVLRYQIKNGQFGEEASKATKRLKGDQVQSHEASGCHGEKQLLSLSVQQPNSETAPEKKKTQSFLSSVQQPSSETTDDKKNPQGTTDAPGKPGSNIRKRKITLAMIENYFDRSLQDAAVELKVSKSTLKRHCRKYGIKSWPSPKRNKAKPVLRPSNELGDCGGKEQECDSRPSPDHSSRERKDTITSISIIPDANRPGNYNFDLNHSFIVKAKYNEFLVKFPFSTHSGIEALHKSLAMRFKLEAEMIRIEYEDEDGDRVMISCDEDLSYHMHTLSSSGRTRMDLSVLPAV